MATEFVIALHWGATKASQTGRRQVNGALAEVHPDVHTVGGGAGR